MKQIKSLADELRETIRKDGNHGDQDSPGTPETKNLKSSRGIKKSTDAQLDKLFLSILSFELAGKEKLLIRLDDRTVFLLKQLKIAKGIDMNKLIAFSLQQFLSVHPEIIQFIKENIKTIEL